MSRSCCAAPDPGERGHLLVGLMVLIAVMLILLTVTAQSWVFITRRDREAEMIFRGEEYARALMFYKAETGNFPLELKILMQRGPHRHRFIRRLYKDPLADDGKWGHIYLSPTGKGFINPYASRMDTRDPFGGTGGRPSAFRAGGGLDTMVDRTGDAFLQAREHKRNQEAEETTGYSELTPDEFEARGGERQGLPIVGVVHKKRESGLKIYKNQANLNDWAFTLLLEGQETLGTPAGAGGPRPQETQGIGDSTNPILIHSKPAPKPELNPRQKMQQKAREEELKRRKEEAEQSGDDTYEEDPGDEDDAEDEGYPEEEPPPDEDPNAPAEDDGSSPRP